MYSNRMQLLRYSFTQETFGSLGNRMLSTSRSHGKWLGVERIFIIRHGESLGNIDKRVFNDVADHAIPLSDRGKRQAKQSGTALADYYKNIYGNANEANKHCRRTMFVSPFIRTRDTADIIQSEMGDWITSRREHLMLVEQDFGLFEGVGFDQAKKLYPEEWKHFTKRWKFQGGFYCRLPLGESKLDVCGRVQQAFGSFLRTADTFEKEGLSTDLIIVTHGVTLRAIVMMWLNLSPEWFEVEPNPNNCAIRLIRRNVDEGYIFDGFSADKDEKDVKDRFREYTNNKLDNESD